KVDTNHPDGRRAGLTLEAEERLEAREWEIKRTAERFDRRLDSDREARTRTVVREASVEQRRVFKERAAAVDPWQDPERADAREQVSKAELGWVNEEARRLSGMLPGWSRAAISRRLAERVVDGVSKTAAVVGVFEELQTDAGQVLPIAALADVPVREVSVSGVVTTLWDPSSPAIQQVGLIEDESGKTKLTVWSRSAQPVVEEGERVVLRNVAKSWYEGRVSVALTGRSSISFPEREAWWAE
ncbi:DNA-binding protein, partial [Halolamina litorea]